jgi:UDP-glucose 4-epimerase
MKKIIVTGGAGFIGSHLVKELAALGHEVKIYDIALDPTLDVRDLNATRTFIKGAEYVFHLAAIPSVQYSLEHPEETHRTNLEGTLNVLIASQEAGVKRVMFASSCAVYGDTEIFPTAENVPAQPKSPYALEKFESEEYLKLFYRMYNLEAVSLRYFNVYGPGQSSKGAYASVIPKFIEQKNAGKTLTITGDGEQTRDFVHVSDIVRANILAMQSENVGRGEIINIGSGKESSVNLIAGFFDTKTENTSPRIEPRRALADISLAKKLLAWEPQVELKEGIKELLK